LFQLFGIEEFMSLVFTILFIIVAFVLIATILVQQPKTSGGLFAGTGQSLLGTSGKTFWTKTTIGMAAVFMILCIILAILPRYEQPASVADIIAKQQQQAAQAPVSTAPSSANPSANAPAPQGVPAAAQAVAPAQQAAPAAK
jgi:protein translocase SecG subunit